MNMHKEALPYHGELPPPAVARPQEPFSFREFLSILFKDGRRILAAFLIPMILFTIVSFLPTPKYEASSTLLVKMGREYVYRPEVGENNVQPIASDRTLAILSEAEILNSRDLQEQVIKQVGLDKLYPSIAESADDPDSPRMSRALVQFKKQLNVEPLKESTIIQVSFKHPDPVIAAEVVNKLVADYLQKRRDIYSGESVTLEEGQVKKMKDQLLGMEGKIEQFKKNHNIISFDSQQTLLLNQRDALEAKLKTASSDLAEATGRLEAVKRNAASVSKDIRMYSENTPDDALVAARKSLLDLRLKEGDALAKYTDQNPVVVDLRTQIKRAQKLVSDLESKKTDTVRVGRNPVRDTVEADLIRFQGEQRAAEASREVLTKQLASINEQLAALSAQQPKLDEMMRERQLMDSTYQNYVKKLEDSKVMANLARNADTNVSVVQKALPPIEKKNLQMIILAIGLVLSGCFALAVAFLSELLRGTYVSPEKVQRSLGLPVLASIPYRSHPPRRLQLAS